MKKILSIALIGLLTCGALLAGCGGDKKSDPKAAGDKTKVAFVYVSSAKDGGYSMAHELGRQYVEKTCPTFRPVTSNPFPRVPILNASSLNWLPRATK